MEDSNSKKPAGFFADDFELRKDTSRTEIDSNFSALSYWKEVRKRFFANKGAVISCVVILLIVFLAAFGPKMNG